MLVCNFVVSIMSVGGNSLVHSLVRRAVLIADIDVWLKELSSDFDDIFQSDLS